MSEKIEIKKIMSKSEYAIELNISVRTLSRWLNNLYFNELKNFGYSKYQKFLFPEQLKFLNQKLCNY